MIPTIILPVIPAPAEFVSVADLRFFVQQLVPTDNNLHNLCLEELRVTCHIFEEKEPSGD